MRFLSIRFPTFNWLADRWRDSVTWPGRILLVIVAVTSSQLLNVGSGAYSVFWGLGTLMVVSWAVGRVLQPRVSIRVRSPGRIVRGERFSLRLDVMNSSSRSTFDVTVMPAGENGGVTLGLEPVEIGSLRPGERRTIDVPAVAYRRGHMRELVWQIGSTFPFNLFRSLTTLRTPAELVVVPRPRSMQDSGHAISAAGPAASANSNLGIGGWEEFAGNREYSAGLPVRRLDYVAWARLGRPVVREYQPDRMARAGIRIVGHPFDRDCGASPVSAERVHREDQFGNWHHHGRDSTSWQVALAEEALSDWIAGIAQRLYRDQVQVAWLARNQRVIWTARHGRSAGYSSILSELSRLRLDTEPTGPLERPDSCQSRADQVVVLRGPWRGGDAPLEPDDSRERPAVVLQIDRQAWFHALTQLDALLEPTRRATAPDGSKKSFQRPVLWRVGRWSTP